MKYLIIGLGIYGGNLARDLTDMGHEVIGVDLRRANVEAVKDYISTVYVIDSTDESALAVLPLKNVDLVIVAIGENFGASIKTVALLKKAGVEHIYARAIDKLHESILQGFEIDRILTPEQRAAKDLVHEMALGSDIESMNIDDDSYILKFTVPDYFIGLKYSDMELRRDYGMELIAVTRLSDRRNLLGITRPQPQRIAPEMFAETEVQKGDTIVCIGTSKSYRELFSHIEN